MGRRHLKQKYMGKYSIKNILRHSLEREVKRGTEKPSPHPSLTGGAKEESLPCEREVRRGHIKALLLPLPDRRG